jgi:hypothetical protein
VCSARAEHTDLAVGAPPPEADRRRNRALAASPSVIAALPFLIMAARVLWERGDPQYSGDAGLLAMGVRSAAHGTRTLGPYSRFGFFHPGPAFFYALVPFEWITANARWALPLGVAVLNALFAATLVGIVQHRTTDPSRRVVSGAAAAVVVLAYALSVDIGLLSILWNPLQIMLPTALLLVAAASVDGWGWPVGVVAITSTFIVQTEIGTLPVAVVAVGCAIAFLARGSWRNLSHAWGGLALTAFAVVAWLPPLWQQLTADRGNVADLWSFFRSSSSARPGVGRAVTYAGRELAVFPARMPWRGELTPGTVHGRWGAGAYALFVGAAVVLIYVARRCEEPRARRLGIVSLAASIAAVYTVTAVRGPVYWYLIAYLTAIAVPVALGWILLALHTYEAWARRVVAIVLLVAASAAVFVASTTSLYDNRAFPFEARYRSDVESAWALLAPNVTTFRGHTIVLGGDPALVPTISGIALKLEHNGVGVRVTDALVPTFGPERRAPATRRPDILVTTTPPDGYDTLGRTSSVMLRLPVVVSIAP